MPFVYSSKITCKCGDTDCYFLVMVNNKKKTRCIVKKCRQCVREYASEYYYANRAKNLKKQKEWWARNKDNPKFREYHREYNSKWYRKNKMRATEV